MFSLKLGSRPAWQREKNLNLPLVCFLVKPPETRRDIEMIMHPDLCRYPDVLLMMNPNLENTLQSPGSPARVTPPPSPLVSAVFYYLYFLLCDWDGWLAGDESWGGARGITDGGWICHLPGSLKKFGLKGEDADMEASQPRSSASSFLLVRQGSGAGARTSSCHHFWPLSKPTT